MIIGPRYKIARRVGAPIFEKTQTQKYAASQARRAKGSERGPRQKSDFGLQMAEKQKARFTYLLLEKQFSNYVNKAIATKGNSPALLYSLFERRLDNVVYRMGFAATRSASRQMVSHGHITVNGRRVTIPSIQVRQGDVIGIRAGSLNKPLFANISDRIKNSTSPAWIKVDLEKRQAEITGIPNYETEKAGLQFDLSAVIEFYSR